MDKDTKLLCEAYATVQNELDAAERAIRRYGKIVDGE